MGGANITTKDPSIGTEGPPVLEQKAPQYWNRRPPKGMKAPKGMRVGELSHQEWERDKRKSDWGQMTKVHYIHV